MNIKPMGERVLLEKIEKEKKSKIILVDEINNNIQYFKILALGQNIEKIKINDIIIADIEKCIKIEDKYIVDFTDILASVEE